MTREGQKAGPDPDVAVGALLSGIIADLFGIGVAISAIGVLTFLSGMIVTFTMEETLSPHVPETENKRM